METITYSDIIKQTALQCGYTKYEARRVMDNMIDIVNKHLLDGKVVRLYGLGVLKTKQDQNRTGYNFHTKEKITFKARRRVIFKTAKSVKALLNPDV